MVDGPQIDIPVGIKTDPGARAEGEQMGREAGAGTKAGFEHATEEIGRQLAANMKEGFKGGQAGAKQTASSVNDLYDALTDVGKILVNLRNYMRSLGEATSVVAAATRGQAEAIRVGVNRETATLQSAVKERTAIIEAEGKRQAAITQAEGFKQLAVVRGQAQQRVAITRGMVDTIGKLEKGLGVAIAGIARTATSAVSRTFSGLGSTLSAAFRRADSGLSGSSSVLRSELRQRETALQTSFRRQESTIRESVSRQEKILASARTSTQTGLLGAASRGGLFASIGAAVGIGAAARSTFTIGADFTRGLAVLQAQLGLTNTEMKAIRQTALDLGNDLSLPGVSALDAAQAIQLLSKQFASLGDGASKAAVDAAKGTLQLARAAGVGAEQAAQVVGSAVNVFGVAASDAVAVADQIAGALKNAAGVSFDDFAAAFKQGASVFSQFVTPAEGATESLNDFNTALALMARSGLVGSDAGTSLKNFFLQANRGTDDANAALAEISERAGVAGTAFFNADGSSRDFSETLDILRRGLVGLTDEQRNSTLQTLFGTDAQRVANALLSVSAEEYEKVKTSIREQGLAAKIAAAQNAGFAGALDALRSVIETIQIQVYQFLEPALKTATLAIANFVSVLAFGDGEVLRTVRQGLLGVAAGLAAILALKGAVEVISLLGKALALVATPMGALVLAFALIGGAFGIMSAQGLSLTEVFDNVKAKVLELGKAGLDILIPKLIQLRELFTGTIIPAAQRLAETVGAALVTAFQATVSFIESRVIPALRVAASFITGTLVPAALNAGSAIKSFVLDALGALADLGRRIQPVVQPLLSGFADLGRAIGAAFTGDFGGLGAGLAAAGSGIASTAVQIGKNIVTALTPIAKTVGNFFKGLFTVDNLIGAVDGIAAVLNFVAEKLAQIVSHPKFLAAVGIAAAALVAVGVKWGLAIITGLGEGLLKNLPQLLNNLGKFFIDNFGLVIAGLAGAVAFGPALISAFKTVFLGAGTASGQSFVQGFKSKASDTGQFLRTLFTGNAGQSSQSVLGGLIKDAQTLTNQFRILGVTKVVDPSSIAAASREVQTLRGRLSDAEFAALQFRDKLNSLGNLRSTLGQGLSQALGGQLRAGLTTAFEGLRTYATEQGTTVGRLIGGSIAKGLAGATAAAGAGVAFGQSLGNGGGLMSLLGLGGSAAGIGLAIGGPWGAAAAAATLAIGGITAAFTASGAEAKKYKAEVAAITKAIDPALTEAARNGQLSLEQLKSGLNFSDVGGTDAFGKILEQFQGTLSTGTQKSILDLIGGSSFITASLKAGESVEQLQSRFATLAVTTGKFADDFGSDGTQVLEIISKLNESGVGLNQLKFGNLTGILTPAQLEIGRKYATQITEIVGINGKLATGYDKVAASLRDFGTNQAFAQTALQGTQNILGVLPDGLIEVKEAIEDVNFTPLDIKTSNTVAIDTINTALDELLARKAEIDRVFNGGVLPPGATASSDAVNTALLSVTGSGAQLEQTLTNTVSEAVRNAQQSEILKGLSDSAAKVIGTGFKEGLVVDSATASSIIQPLIDEALVGVENPTLRQAILDTFSNVVLELVPTIEEAKALDATQLALSVAQATADGSPIAVGITPPEIGMTAPLADAQAAADGNPIVIPANPPTIPTTFMDGQQAALSAAGKSAGGFLGSGLVIGINSKQEAVRQAAANLAQIAINSTTLRAGIGSPSKVFMKLGRFISIGFAIGIEDGAGDVSSSIEKVISRAIAAAQGQVSEASQIMRRSAGTLFDAFFGSDNANGGTRIGDVSAAVTQAFNSLGSALDSSFQQAADVLKRSATERLGRADLDILGEQAGSLNPGDVLGANNRAAVVGALSSIIDVGKEMINQGASADQVSNSLRAYIGQFRVLAAQYGLNESEVTALIDQMGLSGNSINEFVNSLSTLARGLGQVQSNAMKLNDTIVELFSKATADADLFRTPQGVANAEAARGALTSAFQGIRSTLDQSFASIRDANAAGAEATLAQRALQGGNALSLSFGDVTGVANRGAFTDALGAIRDLGKALLEGGSSAEYVNGEIRRQVDELINFGASLGFNADQIRELANQLGLSGTALDEFLKSVDAARAAAEAAKAAQDAANNATPTVPGTPQAGNNPTGEPGTNQYNFSITQNLPYADPAAIALATANGVARAVRLPV